MVGHPNEQQKPRGKRWPWIALGVLLAVAATPSVVAQFIDPPSTSGPAQRSDNSGMARVMCEDFVKDRLVSPTSADFSRPDVRNAGGSDYWVAGSVDADNRMGAAIRIDYECTVRDEGDGSWTLQNMEHTER